jgi:hypothetical protein
VLTAKCFEAFERRRNLVRLITAPSSSVPDRSICGSGSTGKACALEGRGFIGIELDPSGDIAGQHGAVIDCKTQLAEAERHRLWVCEVAVAQVFRRESSKCVC